MPKHEARKLLHGSAFRAPALPARSGWALAEWPLCEVVVRLVVSDRTITLARIAIDGVVSIPFLLTEVEAALEGNPATDETIEAAAMLATERAQCQRPAL